MNILIKSAQLHFTPIQRVHAHDGNDSQSIFQQAHILQLFSTKH